MLSFSVSQSSARVIDDRARVDARLGELGPGLDVETLQEANLQGYRHRLEAGEAHAKTAPGTYHWHEVIPALTLRLQEAGWTRLNIKNCPVMQSPDKAVALFVITGDPDTGKQPGNPSNQSAKGTVLERAIHPEREMVAAAQQLFESGAGTQPWVSLYHAELGIHGVREIRAEVSCPSEFRGKKIRNWAERILLPAIRPNDDVEPVFGNVEASPVDVPVQRKSAS